MALGPEDLVLCAGTLAHSSFEERVDAAVAGGFCGLSLFPSDYRSARATGLSDADLRSLLAGAGLEIAELDPLISWLPGAESDLPMFQGREDEFYAIAQALGARSINAVVFAPETLDWSRIVDHFAALCERAAAHELLVHLEFMPFSQISNALQAWDVVQAAGRDNGGIMLDSWHHFRSGVSNQALRERVPLQRILAVQLNDAPREAEGDLVAETLHHRRLPGDGDIDLPDLIRSLREGGSPAPLGVEVFCDDLLPLAPDEVARRCGDATRLAIARSRL